MNIIPQISQNVVLLLITGTFFSKKSTLKLLNGDILQLIVQEYTYEKELKQFRQLLQTGKITLRILDFVCLTYFKTIYYVQLKKFTKKNFDFFRRQNSELYVYKEYTFSIAQINMFKWCLNNQIIDYCIKNVGDIKNDMKFRYESRYRKKLL
jgi:hypothetical protein